MKKGGLTHVEAIISFVFFAGFLTAGLYFLNPVQQGAKKLLDSTSVYAIGEVSDNATSEILSYSVVIKNSVPLSIDVVSVPIEIGSSQGIRVENNNGKKIDSSYGSGELSFDRDGERFFVVRIGDFNVQNSQIGRAQKLLAGEYEISSSDKRNVLNEAKALEIEGLYKSNYNKLKNNFNLPKNADFSFSVSFASGEIIGSSIDISENVDVFSKSA